MAGSNLFLVIPYPITLRFESFDFRVNKVPVLTCIANEDEGRAPSPTQKRRLTCWWFDLFSVSHERRGRTCAMKLMSGETLMKLPRLHTQSGNSSKEIITPTPLKLLRLFIVKGQSERGDAF